MDTNELARVLRDATADVEPRQGFTAAVVRGGRRRKARNRIVLVSGATAFSALAATSTYVLWPDPTPAVNQAADPRLTQPTAGDFAGDKEFLNAAARAWREGLPRSWNADRGIFDDLRGTPHIYWAGNTPAGPAAVVMQRAYLHPHGNLSAGNFNQFQTLVGLVAADPADHKLKLVYDQYQPDHFGPPGYFQFGPGDRTVLIVDSGTPLYFSPAPVIGLDGRITREWVRMPVTAGVAVAEISDGVDPKDVRVLARATPPAPGDKQFDGLVLLEPSSGYLKFAKDGSFPGTLGPTTDNRLRWNDEQARMMRVGTPYDKVPDDPQSFFSDALDRAGLTDIGGMSRGTGGWHILAGLQGGRAVLVSELQQDNKPSNVYAVFLNPDGSVDHGIRAGAADPTSPLPVRIHLPDEQGWIVANYGATLQYRTSPTTGWQDAGTNAALLPDNATQVRAGTQVVELNP